MHSKSLRPPALSDTKSSRSKHPQPPKQGEGQALIRDDTPEWGRSGREWAGVGGRDRP